LLKSFTLLLAGFGLATFFLLMLLTWNICPTWMKVYWVFILGGIAYLNWGLASANNSQANKQKAAPNTNHCPIMRVRDEIASDPYNKSDYSQADARRCFHSHTLIIPIKFCMRVYRLIKGLSTKMQKNRVAGSIDFD